MTTKPLSSIRLGDPQFDPEAAGTMNGTNIVNGLEMGALPMTRTYGFNIKLSF